MILVDIYVPSMNQGYDFRLEQNAVISSVIDELVEVISQKEKCSLIGDQEKLSLCSYERQTILPKKNTLAECGIHTGSKLMLV